MISDEILLGLIIGVFFLVIILFIAIIVIGIKFSKFNKKLKKFMNSKSVEDLEGIILEKFDQMDSLNLDNKKINENIQEIMLKLSGAYQKIGIVKYDAFKEMAGELSFSLSLLDENNNGFVINNIHGRQGSYAYIKKIVKGECPLKLSEEEKEAISQAINL